MFKTTYVKITKEDLPKWAQKHPAVVKLALSDYAYLCDIISAKTTEWKRVLIKTAERIYPDEC